MLRTLNDRVVSHLLSDFLQDSEGLTWEEYKELNWEDALEWCRLPTKEEMEQC